MEKTEITKHLFNSICELNLWNVDINTQDDYIYISGPKEKLIWLLKDIFDWDRDCDYVTHTINNFEITITFNNFNLITFRNLMK